MNLKAALTAVFLNLCLAATAFAWGDSAKQEDWNVGAEISTIESRQDYNAAIRKAILTGDNTDLLAIDSEIVALKAKLSK